MQDQNSKLIRKILFSYAVTFIIINLTDSLTMIADGMVISRGLGAGALAAIGLADPSYKIASLFSGVLSVGMEALCAQAIGSGDRERANRILSTGLIITLTTVVLLTSAGFIGKDMLCRLFGAGGDPVIYQYLRDYLSGWFTGIPGYIIFFVLSPLVVLDGNKKGVTLGTFVQSVVNIAGDIIAVFLLDAGTYGVGFSTGLSYNISAVLLILSLASKRSVFKWFSARPDFRALPKMMRNGFPQITEQVSKILAPLLINRIIIAVGGSLAMSAFSVKSSILGFCVIIGNGIAKSIATMAQILFSEKDAESLKKTVQVGLELLFLLDAVFCVLLFAFAGVISGFYLVPGTEECVMATYVIRCLAVSLILNGCNSIILRYLQAVEKMVQVHLMTSFHRVVSLTIFTALLGFRFGTKGLFVAIPISEAAVLVGYIASALLANRKVGFWNAVLFIRDGFGYDSENSRSFSITTLEEAVAVSEQVELFCEQHHVDRRTGYFSARCMEELSTNVVQRGFAMDTKKHYCDIRVMIDGDEVTLRLRDDCPYFNIRERYNSLAEDDIDAGVWIRMVFALAKDINYINIFNTNTLIIKM